MRVSVVIPAWNDAEYLRACLRALAAQTRQADEIIVVDNGSTDATAVVAREAGATVIAVPVRGILRATAAGFDAAHGDILARVDADSVPAADWIERLVAVFAREPGIAAVTGTASFYGATAPVRWIGVHVYLALYFAGMGLVLGHPPLFGSNCGIRADAWRTLSPTVHRNRRRLHDDLDISFHLTADMVVRYDGRLRVAVSARPFASPSALGRRIGWAFLTIALNWAEESPWRRLAHRRRRRARSGHGTAGAAPSRTARGPTDTS